MTVLTPIAPPIDARGWTSATLEVRASSVRRPVRVLALSMRVGPDGRGEPDGSEPLAAIDVEGHGERLLVAALATPLPSFVGVYVEAEAEAVDEIEVNVVGDARDDNLRPRSGPPSTRTDPRPLVRLA